MLPIMMVTVMPLHGDDDEYLMMSVMMTMVVHVIVMMVEKHIAKNIRCVTD